MALGTLMLVRHGESVANARSLFTGVIDVGLTPAGVADCGVAGRRLRQVGFDPDALVTSWLVRGWRTAELIAPEIGFTAGIERCWELNERNYGALSGLGKAEVRRRHGQERFRYWRRSYDGRPPPLPDSTLSLWRGLPPYDALPQQALTPTESLADVVERIRPWWNRDLVPRLRSGQDVLVVAHGNSLRALCAVIDGLSPREVSALNLPNARPLRYRFTTATATATATATGTGSGIDTDASTGTGNGKGPGPGTTTGAGTDTVTGTGDSVGLAPAPRGGQYLDPDAAHHEARVIAAQGGT